MKSRDRSNERDRSRLFTELSVSKMKLLRGERDAVYRDRKAQGLLLRLKKSGAKGWRVQYYSRDDKKMHTERLGEFPDMSVKDARRAAMNFHANLGSILQDRKATADANRATFRDVAEWYFREHVQNRLRTASQVRRHIDAIMPAWGDKPFEAISRRQVHDLLEHISKTRGPRSADVTLAILRRMMNRHSIRSDSYNSPVIRGMGKIEDYRERARTRILTDDEIRLLFKACDQIGTFGALCKFLLYTAQRRSKCATVRFDDIREGVWVIRTERREKSNAQRLKLPKPVLDIIAAQAEVRVNSYIFPSRAKRSEHPRENAGSFSAFGEGKVALDKLMGPIPHWQLHDLRRTARSLMSRAGVRGDVAERVLGHSIPGVEGVYDRHDWNVEREQALFTLATLIGEIINPAPGGNVVTLRR